MARAFHVRGVYRSHAHPLVRRSALPFAFPGTTQPVPTPAPGSVATLKQRRRKRDLVERIWNERQAFPQHILLHTPIPEPPDTSTHLSQPIPPKRKPRWEIWERQAFRKNRRRHVRVLPPSQEDLFDGTILGELKVAATHLIDDLQAEPTYAGSCGVNLEKIT